MNLTSNGWHVPPPIVLVPTENGTTLALSNDLIAQTGGTSTGECMRGDLWITIWATNSLSPPPAAALYIPFICVLYFPLFALLLMVFWRREQALEHLGLVKSNSVRWGHAARPRGVQE